MKRICGLLVVCTALGACLGAITAGAASDPKSDADAEAGRLAHDRLLCHKYGYEEGSDELAHCLDVMAKRRAEAAADASKQRRDASSNQRAVSNALNSGCEGRSEVINGGSRVKANAGELAGTCSH